MSNDELTKCIPVMGVQEDSCVDGVGLRYVLFVQGCPHHCVGCHNPQSWAFTSGKQTSLREIYDTVVDNPMWDGITFSGGEPFIYAHELAELAKALHEAGKNVWSFSGWTYEELVKREDAQELLRNIDVLVDGRFIQSKRDISLVFRGSSNQRIIDMNQTRALGEITPLILNKKIVG